MTDPTSPKKTALYVDFDNIYLGLRGEDTVAAEEFATSPQRWLRWLEQDMVEDAAEEPELRRILVRRCYLNPHSFGRYRGYFTRSGFSVIDCPPLTSRSKNSADIVMVMDIMDALEHQTRFDEFIIMSGDADFTPVLHRLRMHDRRIAVLVSGGVAPAYRAACDHLIREDVFIENALRVAQAVEPELFATIAQRVHDEVAGAPNQQLAAADLPRILREFPAFTAGSNWLGFYSQRALTQALFQRRPELTYVDGDISRIGLRGPLDASGAASGADADRTEVESLRARIAERLRALVAGSSIPVVMATAAHALIREFGESLRSSNWLGAGTFRDFLASFSDAGFAVAPVPIPGYLYDPQRHELPTDSVPLAGVPPEIAALIGRVNQVTDAPRLSPRQYRVAFETIAAVVNASGYHLIGTGKVARDRCVEQGEQISRQSITWILGQLSSQGAFTTGQPVLPERLASAFRTAVVNLLLAADITLDDAERALLDDWLLGGQTATAQPDEPAAVKPDEPDVAKPDEPDAANADERAADEHENETTSVEPPG